jgi:hypothetical protein
MPNIGLCNPTPNANPNHGKKKFGLILVLILISNRNFGQLQYQKLKAPKCNTLPNLSLSYRTLPNVTHVTVMLPKNMFT